MTAAAELREIAILIRMAVTRLNRVHGEVGADTRARIDDAASVIDPAVADALETIARELPV